MCRHRSEGEGGINWELRFDIKALSCVKQTASGKMLDSTGSPSLVLCGDPDGGDGVVGSSARGVGGYMYKWS